MLHQLPLAFQLLDNATFSSFFQGDSNKKTLFGLQQFLKNIISQNCNNSSTEPYVRENFLYLWGKSGVGKTHLLQATCNYALENNIQAMYVSLAHIIDVKNSYDNESTANLCDIDEIIIKRDYLSGLETVELLCLDDLECIIQYPRLQEEVFYLFNKMRNLGNKLIIAANDSPLHIQLNLLDLKSRMSWGITYLLVELSETEKIEALIMRSKQVGLDLRLEVAKFLISRVSRSTKDLFSLLSILDNATLAAKRKLTVPFIKELLKI